MKECGRRLRQHTGHSLNALTLSNLPLVHQPKWRQLDRKRDAPSGTKSAWRSYHASVRATLAMEQSLTQARLPSSTFARWFVSLLAW